MTLRRSFVVAALLTCLVVATTAGAGGAAKAKSPDYAAMLASLYKGKVVPPPTSGPKAVKGKSVWFISCGSQFEACVANEKGIRAAAKKLGWKLTVFDGKVLPSLASQGIRQAIAAKADLIAESAYDCATIKAPLQEARAAGIPVVAAGASDCNAQGGQKLFAGNTYLYDGGDFGKFLYQWSVFKAQYIGAKSKGTAKVIDVHEVSSYVQQLAHKGFLKGLKSCPTCKIVATVPYDWAHVTDLTQKVSAALLQHPEATAINLPADTLIPSFVQGPVRQAGRQGKLIVMGGEGYRPNIQLIRDGVQTAAMAFSSEWTGWALADVGNRILALGTKAKIPNEGSGFQAVDLQHNLPKPGQAYTPPIDFAAAYAKLWGVG